MKSLIWSLSLGSGTSGGVLAPLLMIGAALGCARGASSSRPSAPASGPLVGIAAILGGMMRSPLTGVVFALELTHDWDALLPLLIAATVGLRVLGARCCGARSSPRRSRAAAST